MFKANKSWEIPIHLECLMHFSFPVSCYASEMHPNVADMCPSQYKLLSMRNYELVLMTVCASKQDPLNY